MYDFGDAYFMKSNTNATLGVPDLGMLIMAYALWGAGVLATGYGAFLLALAKIGLAVTLGVGPIFILLTIFEPTKRFFDACPPSAQLRLPGDARGSHDQTNHDYPANLFDRRQRFHTSADPSLNQALPAIVFFAYRCPGPVQMPTMAATLGGGLAISTLGAVGGPLGKRKAECLR